MRSCFALFKNQMHPIDPDNQWEKLYRIGLIEFVRIVNGKTTIKTRYYISSSPNNAQKIGESVRSHWVLKILYIGY